jgi:hypothetical protein
MSKTIKVPKVSKISPDDLETLLKSDINKGQLQIEEMLIIFEERDLTKEIHNIGNTIKKFYKTNKTLNDIVYDYIVNNDDLQNIMRNVMYDAIQTNRERFLDDFSNLAKEMELRISDDAVMGCIIKWYDNLYDMGGLFESPCLGIIHTELTTNCYREQIYNIMEAFANMPC